MYKVFNIGGIEVPANATAALPYRFQQCFHEDFLEWIGQDLDFTKTFEFAEKILYITNASAEKKDMGALNMDAFVEFLEQFGNGDMVVAANDIVSFAFEASKPAVSPKDVPGEQNGN